METISNYLYFIALCIIIYFMIVGIINLTLQHFIKDKWHIKIRISNSKKYKNNPSSIYELTKDLAGNYVIKKWTLQWINISNENFLLFIFLILFIYPIEIIKQKYCEEDSLFIGPTYYVNKIIESGISLKDYYEIESLKLAEKSEREWNDYIQFDNNINNLNDEFNKNYVK